MPFQSLLRVWLCVAAALLIAPDDIRAQTAATPGTDDDAINANPKPLDAPPLTSTLARPSFETANPAPALTPPVAPGAVAPPALNPTPADPGTTTPETKQAESQQPPESPTAPYYGKTRPKKPKLYKPNPKTSPPLSPLVPYRGAPGLPKRLLNPAPPPKDAVDPSLPAPTVAVIQSPDRVRKPILEEDDPFLPTGVAAGALRLFPFVETSAGYETNPNQTTTSVKSSPLLRAEGGFDVKSDFSSNSLTASLRGGYSDYPRNSNANRPDVSGLVDGRIDVTRDDKIDVEGRLTLATQTPGSPLLAVPGSVFLVSRPTIITEGATLGGTHTFNRLSLSLRGTFDRFDYGDGTESDGSVLLLSRDSYNDYGVVGKAAYELTPAIIPFAEISYDSRVHDQVLDLGGYERNSIGLSGRLGSTFEFTRLLTGTASAGYADRHYEDPRLPHLRGPTADGSLVYTYSPVTKAIFTATTTLAETTLAGASGAITRGITLELDHTLFRNFTLSGIGTFQVNQYQGASVNETFTIGTLKGTYSVNREVQLTASATRQLLNSSIQGASYVDNIFLIGMRLQR